MMRQDARFVAGDYFGKFLIAESDSSGSIIALVCDGEPGRLNTVADFWFQSVDDFRAAVTEDDWAVEWLPDGSLGRPDEHLEGRVPWDRS